MSKLFLTIEFIELSIYFIYFLSMSLMWMLRNYLYKTVSNLARISNPLQAFSAIFFYLGLAYSLLFLRSFNLSACQITLLLDIFFIYRNASYLLRVRDLRLALSSVFNASNWLFSNLATILYYRSISTCYSSSAILFCRIIVSFSYSSAVD